MLKKAGIVVATAAVGLLAVSPLAFAGTSGKDHHGYSHGEDVDVASSSIQKDSQGLINALNNPNVTVDPQVCNIDVLKVADNINALAGAVALLGFADDSDTISSSDACTQANVGPDVSTAHEG